MSMWDKNKVGCILLDKKLAQPCNKGDKRTQKPAWDELKCTKCGLCYLFCPDAAIKEKADGFFISDVDYCKGCGICARECWFGAITMAKEG
jgi:pyruvate ferredoxin oxidoreductase delta subunit